MQLLAINDNTKMADLIRSVGSRNAASLLAANGLSWTPNPGKEFQQLCNSLIAKANPVSPQKKSSLLNSVTADSDIFETVALMGEDGWKLFSELGTVPGNLRVPDSMQLPDSVAITGNGQHIESTIYRKAMDQLATPPYTIDPSIFNEYSTLNINTREYEIQTGSGDPFMAFRIPWGEFTIYSSLAGESKDFPVYPEEFSDGVKANYTTMPDMLFQYEPWQIYNSSGPRAIALTFHMHRDMWTGDHRDGKCNELIRFCKANCYPDYNGSAVNTSIVTIYVKGNSLITGVLTEASDDWSGPIGLDGWYLECTLKISITEVSVQPLSYSTMRNKGLIG